MEKTRYEGVLYRENKRKRKVFYARFKVNGKAYLKRIGEEPAITAKKASALRYKMIDEIRDGGGYDGKRMDDVFSDYIKLRAPMLSDSFAYNMQKTYDKHLQEIIGSKRPSDVTVAEVQLKMNEMLDAGYAVSTVKQVKDCVSGIFKHMLPKLENVGRMLELPKVDNKVYFTITDEEAKRLYDEIMDHPKLMWRVFFAFLLHGRRRGEVMALKWDDIDMDRRVYTIEAVNNKTGKHIEAPMLPFLVELLEKYREACDGTGWVFRGRWGDRISGGAVEWQWTRIKDRAGLPKMRLHDFRHMIGFIAINSGLSLEEIAYVLGHDSTATTRRYSNMEMDTARRTLEHVFSKIKKTHDAEN